MNLFEHQVKFWNELAPHYDKSVGYEKPYGIYKVLKRRAWLERKVHILRKDYVLELGCGNGKTMGRLTQIGCKVKAIDCSEEMLKQARALNLPNIEYVLGDIHKMQIKSNTFDVAIGTYFLRYIDLDVALKEIARVLKDGARIGFIDTNAYNPFYFIQTRSFIKKLSGSTEIAININPIKFKKQLLASGFTDIHIQSINYFGSYVPQGYIQLVERVSSILRRIPLINMLGGSLMITARIKK